MKKYVSRPSTCCSDRGPCSRGLSALAKTEHRHGYAQRVPAECCVCWWTVLLDPSHVHLTSFSPALAGEKSRTNEQAVQEPARGVRVLEAHPDLKHAMDKQNAYRRAHLHRNTNRIRLLLLQVPLCSRASNRPLSALHHTWKRPLHLHPFSWAILRQQNEANAGVHQAA